MSRHHWDGGNLLSFTDDQALKWDDLQAGGDMLLQTTMAVSLFAMAMTLWMGLYLFARGYPSSMSLRVVVVMLALSAFFFAAYNNIFVQTPGSAAIRAVLLVIVLGGWYSVTYHIMSERNQSRFRFFPLFSFFNPTHSFLRMGMHCMWRI